MDGINSKNFKKFADSLELYSAYPGKESWVEAGNINLLKRPIVKNKDGSISTVKSTSFYDPDSGLEVLIPTVSDSGAILSLKDAVANYYKTKRHLGKFKTSEEATAYAKKLHEQQAAYYLNKPNNKKE